MQGMLNTVISRFFMPRTSHNQFTKQIVCDPSHSVGESFHESSSSSLENLQGTRQQQQNKKKSRVVKVRVPTSLGEALSSRLMAKVKISGMEMDNKKKNVPIRKRRIQTPGVALKHSIVDIAEEEDDHSPEHGLNSSVIHHHRLRIEPIALSSAVSEPEDEPASFHPSIQAHADYHSTSFSVPANQQQDFFKSRSPIKSGTPLSPGCYDETYMNSRMACTLGLVRPEDQKFVSLSERRTKRFRLSRSTLWLRRLNMAVVEKDFRCVKDLLTDPSNCVESEEQLERLARCATVVKDWKTLTILLYYSRRHIESEREVVDACRDIVGQGLVGTCEDIAAQQMCLQLVTCSYTKLPRSFPRRPLTIDELVAVCRNDDVVSLSAAYLAYDEKCLVVCGADFCELKTDIQIPSSRYVEDHPAPLTEEEEQERDRIVSESYFTPPSSQTKHSWSKTSRGSNESDRAYYANELLPQVLNGRHATLHEFAAMVCAARCTFFLNELAAHRIS